MRTVKDEQFTERFKAMPAEERTVYSAINHAISGVYAWNGSAYSPARNLKRFHRMSSKFMRGDLTLHSPEIVDSVLAKWEIHCDELVKAIPEPSPATTVSTRISMLAFSFFDILKKDGIV